MFSYFHQEEGAYETMGCHLDDGWCNGVGLMFVLRVGQAADMTKEKAAEMVLAVVKPARMV